jgi:hypothetical protein
MSSVTDARDTLLSIQYNALCALCLGPVQPPLAQLQASVGGAKIGVTLPHRPDVDRTGRAGPRYQRVKRLLTRAAHLEF